MSEFAAAPRLRPVRPLATAATIALVLPAAVELVRLPVRIDRLRLAVDGSAITNGHLISVLSVLYYVSVLVAGPVFIAWLFRARGNAEVITPGPHRHPAPWLVLGWVVPVADLWVPRRVVLDVWRGSGPPPRPATLVNAWWGCYLAGTFGGTFVAVLFSGRHHDGAAAAVYVVMSVSGIAAATLAAVLIWRIVALQEKAALVPLPAPPPSARPPRRREIVVAAGLALGVVLLSVAARLLPHAATHLHVRNPEQTGYAYGLANSDPMVTDCDKEARHRYGSGGTELAFASGCLQAQLDTLNGDPKPMPSG